MKLWETLDDRIRLYHGCMFNDAVQIEQTGIDLTKGRTRTDFGLGFYLTTNRRQAVDWARAKVRRLRLRRRPHSAPTVIDFAVPWEEFAGLEALTFVLPDYDRYWPLVKHCRAFPAGTHRVAPKSAWYDIAAGPVALSWRDKAEEAKPHSDQYSVHTDKAVAILNKIMAAGGPNFSYKKV